jgi:hypothetical protein
LNIIIQLNSLFNRISENKWIWVTEIYTIKESSAEILQTFKKEPKTSASHKKIRAMQSNQHAIKELNQGQSHISLSQTVKIQSHFTKNKLLII